MGVVTIRLDDSELKLSIEKGMLKLVVSPYIRAERLMQTYTFYIELQKVPILISALDLINTIYGSKEV